jgi:endonuclease/exonuclease/phosphatase family metal-dependent hydrolase
MMATRRRRTALLLALAALVLVVGGVVAVVVRGTGAEPPNRRSFLQFNMCGYVCNDAGLAAADGVVRLIDRRRPHVVTLNEVCENQWNRIQARLSYRGRFDVAAEGRPCTGGHRFGNAILVRGAYTFLGAWSLPKSIEARRILCVRPELPGTPAFTACVTHVEPDPTTIASQVTAIADHLDGFALAGPVLLAGDFNTVPSDPRLHPLYRSSCDPAGTGHFHELDAGPDCRRTGGAEGRNRATFGTDRKFDYLFVTDHWRDRAAEIIDGPGSDHRALWGSATLNQP